MRGRHIAALLALVWAWQAAAFEPRRFALVVGVPSGGPGTQKLRYAERDAKRIHSILIRLGGVRPDDAKLLLSADARDMHRALEELSERSRAARSRGEETLLLVYYSGHAKDGELRLGDTRFPVDQLRSALQRAPADVRIGLIDSCQSGAITRAKGARKAPIFDISKAASSGPQGLVLIASSAADEDSQESDAIGASFFTHYLASGLLGDADTSGDGKVTLAEAYTYAYGRTVGSTVGTSGGVQHPVYLYDLGGAGEVVLTQLAPAAGSLVFPASLEGLYVVLDGAHRAVAEVAKQTGVARRLALPAGRYTVKKRLPSEVGLLVGDYDVGRGAVEVDEARMARLPLEKDPQKGFGGARWTVMAGAGGQYFFDGAARSGLFPPAALGGLELAVRDDLGHGLAWGADLAFGGGSSSLPLDSSSALSFHFWELSGGASIWKELELGPITLSAGVRLATIYIWRTFPQQGGQLPNQYFFTVTPGLVGAATWTLSPNWSLVLRTRLNYLFYNVDRDMNLGYVEGILGIEHAL